MTSFRIFVHRESPSSSLTKISPTLLLIIVLLAAIFFLAGTVHLLTKLLVKRPSSSPESSQRQLRQLFRQHDSGVEQSVIDVLPVFRYDDVIGPKQPFDCAVCLCEFAGRDELRLLPGCGHAFHVRCIDTWLLGNATCPLCRRTLLLADLFDAPTEERENDADGHRVTAIRESTRESYHPSSRVFSVRLEKLSPLNTGGGGGETSRCDVDARRCYSMGSCQYVVSESDLQVTIVVAPASEGNLGDENGGVEGKRIGRRQKGDSFSVSKIWFWSTNGRCPGCSDADVHLPTSVFRPVLESEVNGMSSRDL